MEPNNNQIDRNIISVFLLFKDQKIFFRDFNLDKIENSDLFLENIDENIINLWKTNKITTKWAEILYQYNKTISPYIVI